MADMNEYMMQLLLKEMFSGGKTPEEQEAAQLRLENLRRTSSPQALEQMEQMAEYKVQSAERINELSDLSLLQTMLPDATTEPEFNNINQTYQDIEKRMDDYDPVVQGKIRATGYQIDEDTTLFNQFKSATKLVNGLFIQGELDDPTIENLNWEQITKKNADLGRFQHMINLGKEKGYTYSPEKGTGEGYLHSNLLSKRLDDYIEEFDVQVKFSMDKGDGGNLPSDARRAIQVGDLVGFEQIKARELGNAQRNYSSHSSRYSSLNNAKMQADTKKNADGSINLMPATMMQDLQNKGEGAVQAFTEAIKGDPKLYQAFMGGLQSGSGITVDYETYSDLLDTQMGFESSNVKEANKSYFDWTGSNIETFREAPRYEDIKEAIKTTGLQVDGVDAGIETGIIAPSKTKITVPYADLPGDVRSELEAANIQGIFSVQDMLTSATDKTRDVLSRKGTIKKVNKNLEDEIIKLAQPHIQPYHEKMFTAPSYRKKVKAGKGKYAGAIYKEESPKIKYKYKQAIAKENASYRKQKKELDKDYPEFTITTTPHAKELKKHGDTKRRDLKKTHDDYIRDLNSKMNDELDAITGISKTKGLDREEVLKFATQFTTRAGAQPWFDDMSKEEQTLFMRLVKGYKSNLSLIESKAP